MYCDLTCTIIPGVLAYTSRWLSTWYYSLQLPLTCRCSSHLYRLENFLFRRVSVFCAAVLYCAPPHPTLLHLDPNQTVGALCYLDWSATCSFHLHCLPHGLHQPVPYPTLVLLLLHLSNPYPTLCLPLPHPVPTLGWKKRSLLSCPCLHYTNPPPPHVTLFFFQLVDWWYWKPFGERNQVKLGWLSH